MTRSRNSYRCLVFSFLFALFGSPAHAQVSAVSALLQLKPDVVVAIQLIPGSLFGVPDTGNIIVERAQIGGRIDLDVSRMSTTAAQLASPIQAKMVESGMLVEPRNARFARLATFVQYANITSSVGAGFVDGKTKDGLMLVYFDEPCRISGTLRQGTLEAVHNVSISSRGLHWLRIREPTARHFEIDNADSAIDVILHVIPRA